MENLREKKVFSETFDNDKKAASKQFVDATPLLKKPDALRAKAEEEGYLFFRGLLDSEQLLHVRKQILELIQRWGLLDSAYPIEEAIADYEAVNRLAVESFDGLGVPWELYRSVQKLETFHRLSHQPELLEMFQLLFESEVFTHPRNIARIVIPHRDVRPTPSHQDFLHIQGTPSTWTAWFPLGHCPRSMGGLTVLEGSHKNSVLGVTGNKGPGGLESILCGMDLEWVEGDYQLGDVIVFHSNTVHKALPNRQGNHVRFSCDFRYQPVDGVIDPSSLKPHCSEGLFTWDELYEGWTNDDLKYYWKQFELRYSAWDNSVRRQRDKIC